MMNGEIKKINPEYLKPAPWRATYVLKPDLKLLTVSIARYGLVAPIVVQKQTQHIIDGYHRILAISSNTELTKQFSKGISCLEFDIDNIDSMIMHIQLNRARGSVVAKYMSNIVKQIYQNRKYTINEIDEMFEMGVAESELMLDGSLLKMRKIKEHTYSPAWIPIEAPAVVKETMEFEAPKNKDR